VRICRAGQPGGGRKIARTVFEGCERLKEFPWLGRASMSMPGRRESVFPSLPYIAVYRVTSDTIEVIRIFHGAQNWPYDRRSSSCYTPRNSPCNALQEDRGLEIGDTVEPASQPSALCDLTWAWDFGLPPSAATEL
jgi:plasmid stabilization system protein ParE